MPGAVRGFRLQFCEAKVPAEPVQPVVRLTYVCRGSGGDSTQPGSGFLVGKWRRAIATAAHVVKTPKDGLPRMLQVDALSCDGQRSYTLSACSFAYPDPVRKAEDAAVVLLPIAIPDVSPQFRVGHAGADRFDGRVCGFAGIQPGLCELPVTAKREPPWLRYVTGCGLSGMSGGPVVRGKTNVAGLHLGSLRTSGRVFHGAWAIDQALLNSCLETAMEVMDEKP